MSDTKKPVVKLADLPLVQQRIILALIAARKAAEEKHG